jgi:hypothetical protein
MMMLEALPWGLVGLMSYFLAVQNLYSPTRSSARTLLGLLCILTSISAWTIVILTLMDFSSLNKISRNLWL